MTVIAAGRRKSAGQRGADRHHNHYIIIITLQQPTRFLLSQKRQEQGGARKDHTPGRLGLMCTRKDQRYLSRVTQSGLESLLSSVSPLPPPFTMCLGGKAWFYVIYFKDNFMHTGRVNPTLWSQTVANSEQVWTSFPHAP